MELARRGASVVVNDLGVNPLGTGAGDSSADATVARIVEGGGTAVADTSSVTDADAVERMVRRSVDGLGRVDILVNTAGVVPSGRLDDIDQAAWDRLVGVHVGGHINTVNAVLPHMERQRYGRILNVTSGAGLQRVAAETAVYGTAKRAISALTVALARRAPAGVTINALSPIALTRMVAGPAQAAAASRGASGGPPGYGLDFGNMPAPAALAPVVAYLCGDGVDWLNGRIVFTNGQEASVIVPPRLIEAVHAARGRERMVTWTTPSLPSSHRRPVLGRRPVARCRASWHGRRRRRPTRARRRVWSCGQRRPPERPWSMPFVLRAGRSWVST